MVSALSPRGWHPENRAFLERWLADVAARPAAPRAAVFDWDNTSVFHCFGEALFRTQLDELYLWLAREDLEALVPAELEGRRQIGGRSLADVRADLLEAFDALAPALARRRSGADPASTGLLETDPHRDFRAKLAWLYAALDDEPGLGARVSYPWLIATLGGATAEELRALAARTAERVAAEPIGRGEYATATPGRAGPASFDFTTHVGPQPEVIDLMAGLAEAGVEVWVLTASQQDTIRGAARALGYPVDDERVLGMRLAEAEAEGGPVRYAARVVDEERWPVTWRDGKRRVIAEHIPAAPVLIAGDCETDLEMLTGFADTEVRLVIHRNRGGPFAELYDAPLEGPPATLVQGRDEPAGCFHPYRESVPLSGGLVRS